jgi:hypothetical protein
MKSILSVGIVLLAATFAIGQDDAPKSTAAEKHHCDSYVLPERTTSQQSWEHDVCIAYLRGMKDVMEGELAWQSSTSKTIVVGNWAEGVTTDQLVRVFVKFVNANPETLNKPAIETLRQSAEAASLYTYAPVN